MPTTRSRGRNEPLQRLETPPKRQRKQRIRRPPQPRGPPRPLRMRTFSISPKPTESVSTEIQDASTQTAPVSYTDKATQTEQVLVLTQTEAADLRDRQTGSASTKRTRDDESEDEPTSKRQQFSTPQNAKSNNLWMFGERANGDHPRTAPSKTLAASSLRRPVRGPLSKRNTFTTTPQRRAALNSVSHPVAEFEHIRPIKQDPKLKEDESVEESAAEPAQPAASEAQAQNAPPQTPRGGLFGSLRGIVHKGWDMAATFSPLAARTTSTSSGPQTSDVGAVSYPQLQPTVEDAESPAANNFEAFRRQAQTPGAGRSRRSDISQSRYPASEPSKRHSRYDHLHYVSADQDSVNKAMNGEIEPDNAPAPLSPSSRLRAQNPQLSDAAIGSILKKRERKAAIDEERFGPPQSEEEPQVAPLFGPDSHYTRGTVDPRFLPPTPTYGSGKKRKLGVTDEKTPLQRNKGFGLDDEDIDVEPEIQSTGEPSFEDDDQYEASPSKKQRITESTPVTPRSALKKPGGMGSVGRKSVSFGGSITRDIRYHYGPAGQYKGSTFADDSPRSDGSPSSIDHNDVISPTTQLNTLVNTGKRHSIRDNIGANIPHIDFTLRDPNDDDWRPSLVNPRPGTFRVPDVDEEDPDESMSEDPPEQPQTPRMSHAELPAVTGTTPSAAPNPLGENGAKNGTTDDALDKARSRAEKYKPKSSSRLSNVAQAQSRSPSPERDGDVHTDDDEDEAAAAATPISKPTKSRPAPAVRPIGAPPQPFVAIPLDNVKRGSDGLTDHEREHEFDDWAAGLTWDAPQTYEDAGTASAFIHNLIRKNWGDEDSQRSESFWAREFDEVDRAMELAKGKGHRLTLITGMEDANIGMERVEVA